MPIPEFVVEIRKMIGHHEMWLPGVTAVVTRGDEILLVRRADNGAWTPITGIPEPGEEPGRAAAREALEETGVVVSGRPAGLDQRVSRGRARQRRPGVVPRPHLRLHLRLRRGARGRRRVERRAVVPASTRCRRWRRRCSSGSPTRCRASRPRGSCASRARRQPFDGDAACRRRRVARPCRRRVRRRAGRRCNVPASTSRPPPAWIVDAGRRVRAAQERLVECAADQRPAAAGDLDLLDARHGHRDVLEPGVDRCPRRGAGRPARRRRRACARPASRTA